MAATDTLNVSKLTPEERNALRQALKAYEAEDKEHENQKLKADFVDFLTQRGLSLEAPAAKALLKELAPSVASRAYVARGDATKPKRTMSAKYQDDEGNSWAGNGAHVPTWLAAKMDKGESHEKFLLEGQKPSKLAEAYWKKLQVAK